MNVKYYNCLDTFVEGYVISWNIHLYVAVDPGEWYNEIFEVQENMGVKSRKSTR